jgi:hypothetical protein
VVLLLLLLLPDDHLWLLRSYKCVVFAASTVYCHISWSNTGTLKLWGFEASWGDIPSNLTVLPFNQGWQVSR